MNPEKIRQRLVEHFPDAEILVEDQTGDGEHIFANIVSHAFAGKRVVAQHRMVYECFQSELESGELHALSLKTSAPEG